MRAVTPGYPFRPRGKERGGLTLARPAPVCIGTTRPLPPPASSRPAGGVLILLDQDAKIIRQASDQKSDPMSSASQHPWNHLEAASGASTLGSDGVGYTGGLPSHSEQTIHSHKHSLLKPVVMGGEGSKEEYNERRGRPRERTPTTALNMDPQTIFLSGPG
jgi:hypothetical protein